MDVSNMQSYRKALNINLGVIVNFGNQKYVFLGFKDPRRKLETCIYPSAHKNDPCGFFDPRGIISYVTLFDTI